MKLYQFKGESSFTHLDKPREEVTRGDFYIICILNKMDFFSKFIGMSMFLVKYFVFSLCSNKIYILISIPQSYLRQSNTKKSK